LYLKKLENAQGKSSIYLPSIFDAESQKNLTGFQKLHFPESYEKQSRGVELAKFVRMERDARRIQVEMEQH